MHYLCFQDGEVQQIKLELSKVQSLIDACDVDVREVDREVKDAARRAVDPALSTPWREYLTQARPRLSTPTRAAAEKMRGRHSALRRPST